MQPFVFGKTVGNIAVGMDKNGWVLEANLERLRDQPKISHLLCIDNNKVRMKRKEHPKMRGQPNILCSKPIRIKLRNFAAIHPKKQKRTQTKCLSMPDTNEYYECAFIFYYTSHFILVPSTINRHSNQNRVNKKHKVELVFNSLGRIYFT